MRNFFQSILFSILVIPSICSADEVIDSSVAPIATSSSCCNAPLSIDCCLPPIRFSGELLYFKPGIEQSSYVVSSVSNIIGDEFFPNGTRHHNKPNYKPGFRVEGIYDICDSNSVDLRFAYFNSGHSSSTSGLFLFDTIGFPGEGAQAPEDTSYNGTARLHDRFRYFGTDLTLNRLSLCSCLDNLYLLFGLHYASIQHKAHFTSDGFSIDDGVTVPVDNELHSRSHFWGIGPQIGFDYTYQLPQCCVGCFTLHANMRAALLCSKSNANFSYTSLRTVDTLGISLKNDHVWRVNPAFDARLGASCNFCFCGHEGTIELGYEWLWYHNSVNSITGLDVAFPGNSIDYYSNLSLQGPYLRIGIDF